MKLFKEKVKARNAQGIEFLVDIIEGEGLPYYYAVTDKDCSFLLAYPEELGIPGIPYLLIFLSKKDAYEFFELHKEYLQNNWFRCHFLSDDSFLNVLNKSGKVCVYHTERNREIYNKLMSESDTHNMNLTVKMLKEAIKDLPDDMDIVMAITTEEDSNNIVGFKHVRTMGILKDSSDNDEVVCLNTSENGLDISSQVKKYEPKITCEKILY